MNAAENAIFRSKRHPRGRGRRNPHPDTVKARAEYTRRVHGHRLQALHDRGATPSAYDCRTLNQVTSTQDQGQCGDCYAFSGSSVVADAQLVAAVVSLSQVPLFQISVQWVLDCHGDLGGCNGGDEWQVSQLYLAPNAGGPDVAGYAGSGQQPGQCKSLGGAKLYTISAMGYCDPNQQANGVAATQLIKNCMMQYGPISVAVAASQWGDPGSGTITGNDNQIDHAVKLIGWDDNHDNGDGTKGAWLMQNQWNGWGINGTSVAWIAYGADSIGTEAFWVQATNPTPPPIPIPPAPSGANIFTAEAIIPAGTFQIGNGTITFEASVPAGPWPIDAKPATTLGFTISAPLAAGPHTITTPNGVVNFTTTADLAAGSY